MRSEQDDKKGSSKSKDDGDLITTAEAAAMLRLSPRTLEKMRQRGEGPEYFKIQNRTWYTREKVMAHLASTVRRSTFDPPNAKKEAPPDPPENVSSHREDDHSPPPNGP